MRHKNLYLFQTNQNSYSNILNDYPLTYNDSQMVDLGLSMSLTSDYR